jgi:hypothetical protein
VGERRRRGAGSHRGGRTHDEAQAAIVAAERTISETVRQLRAAGASWAVAGRLLGVTKAAAHKRYGQAQPATSSERQPDDTTASTSASDEVPCPLCGAGPGERCVRLDGAASCEPYSDSTPYVHPERDGTGTSPAWSIEGHRARLSAPTS